MKKLGNRSLVISAAYLVVAFVLCAGIIFYTGNGGTEERKTFADITDTMEASGEIIIGEEEVPLANKPKVTVKKSTKTSTKKKKLKKAAKKTKTVTKTKTSKKKSTSTSKSEKIVKETTVQTKTQTSEKKKSKVQTIKTTVYTTVKTTKTSVSSTSTTTNSTSASSTSDSSFEISKFSDIKGHVDTDVYNAFVNLGFTLKINSSLSTTGVFSVKNHNIQLKRGKSSYLLHELGHFVSALKANADDTDEFKAIYKAEKSSYTGNNKAYVTQDAGEYFAESFRDYTENPSALKSSRPKTYTYINTVVNSISDSDVKTFENYYGWYWDL